jgi:hypothetical protein
VIPSRPRVRSLKKVFPRLSSCRSRFLRTKLALLTGIALGGAVHGQLTTVTVEPDDFPPGERLTDAVPGVTLTAARLAGDPNFDLEVQSMVFSPASTGTRVIGRQAEGSLADYRWFQSATGDYSLLRADFPRATDTVAIDVIRADAASVATGAALEMFDSAGRPLQASFVNLGPEIGAIKTLSFTRPTADVAFVLIGGQPTTAGAPWSAVALDRLRFRRDPSIDPGRPVQVRTTPDSQTLLTVSIAGVGSDSALVRYDGACLGWIRMDGATGTISEVQLAPSRFRATDFTIQVPQVGTTLLSLDGRDIRATVTSLGAPVPVASDGTIAATALQQTLDSGTVTLSWFAPGLPPITVTEDYTLNPQAFPANGPATVSAALVKADDYGREWTVRYRQNIHESVTNDIAGKRVTMTETGMVVMAGTLVTRTTYGAWLDTQGLGDVPFAEAHPSSGLPYGILFALGLAPTPGVQLPWHPDPAGSLTWTLTLPATGTAAVLVVETAQTLAAGTWVRVAPTDISTGNSEIPIGTKGQVKITGRDPRQFFRLKALVPPN